MKKIKRESILDERQEQELLKIEHNGCWLAFWGLLAVLLIEQHILRLDSKALAGEWIIFMILAVYLGIACIRKGIWDRHLKPNGKTNVIISLAAAVIAGIFMAIYVYGNFPDKPVGSIAAGIFMFGLVFVLCVVCLSVSAVLVTKKQQMDEQEEEEE